MKMRNITNHFGLEDVVSWSSYCLGVWQWVVWLLSLFVPH